MSDTWFIIDGYNLVCSHSFRSRRTADMQQSRERLMGLLDEVVGSLADRITVVFDGSSGDADPRTADQPVSAIFSPPDMTADTLIASMVEERPKSTRVTVVTSDNIERMAVVAGGAEVVSCSMFMEILEDERKAVAAKARTTRNPRARGTFGDAFPDM